MLWMQCTTYKIPSNKKNTKNFCVTKKRGSWSGPHQKSNDGRDWTVRTKNSRRLRLSYYLSSFMINSARCDSSCNSRWWDTCRRGCPNLCYVETNHVARSCHVMKRQGKWAHLPVISTFPTFSNSSFCCISIIYSFLNWLSCPCL